MWHAKLDRRSVRLQVAMEDHHPRHQHLISFPCQRLQVCVILLFLLSITISKAEKWEQEIGSQMSIGPSESGYREVALKCGENFMQVQIETDNEFDGVIYTRGSYHGKGHSPCRVDAQGGRKFQLRFDNDQCDTQVEGDVYRNIVVVQHDDELVLPGDAAFKLECDLAKTSELTVSADLQGTQIKSRISLADPDPAAPDLPRDRRSTIESESDSVSFRPSKDEL